MNFFARPPKMEKIKSSYVPEEDVVRYERKDVLKKVVLDEKGNPTDDFLVKEEVVEVERVNRADYINSFRDDIGIKNILSKVALTGDTALLNQIKRTPLPIQEDGKEAIQDVTALQEGEKNIAAMGDNMRKSWFEMPDELKNGRSLEEFCKTVSQAEIDAFVASYVAKQQGGNNDGTK